MMQRLSQVRDPDKWKRDGKEEQLRDYFRGTLPEMLEMCFGLKHDDGLQVVPTPDPRWKVIS